MDYKAEYQRLTGRPWPFAWEPVSGSYDELAAYLAAISGPAEAKQLPNGAWQYTWRPPTRKELRAMADEQELEQLAKRLHTALDDIICIFVSTPNIKYGDYYVLDEALDTLAESARRLNLPLTVSIAQVIENKRGPIWTTQPPAETA